MFYCRTCGYRTPRRIDMANHISDRSRHGETHYYNKTAATPHQCENCRSIDLSLQFDMKLGKEIMRCNSCGKANPLMTGA